MTNLKKYAIFLIMICTLGFSGCGMVKDEVIAVPDQIVLSWTGDPSTTQTISWHGETKYHGVVLCNDVQFPAEVTKIKREDYYRYTAEISGLKAGQTYVYRVGDGLTWSEEHNFSTEKNGEFSFMYLGDIQYEKMEQDYEKWGMFVDDAYKQNPALAFILQGGDLVVEDSVLAEYEAVLAKGQGLFATIPLMTTPGNHEGVVTPDLYKELFALPQNGPNQMKEEVYSFDYGNTHIISLNSNLFGLEMIEDIGQKKWHAKVDKVNDWLKKDLRETDAAWIIVVMHHPPYPVADNLEMYGMIEDTWVPIFEQYGVDLAFIGHQHIYMRTKPINGITYIMARSGEKYSRYYQLGDPIPGFVEVLVETNTYQIISVKADTLSVEAFNAEGKLVDHWEKQQ